MNINISGYQALNIIAALDSSCTDAAALLQNQEFMSRYAYLVQPLNEHIKVCRAVQDQIQNSLAQSA